LDDANPVMVQVYRAHICLARFDEPAADAIIEQLGREYPDDEVYLFEAAQYYAKKGEYEKAIAFYERDFALDEKRPRFTDALDAIKDIYETMGRYKDAAATCDRLIALLKDEWHMTEETALKAAQKEKARLLAKA
ncbi:MAG: tetratricopeptide repeat protein, partial [Clostridia bacterium]|nr:tetratricopeptide repeat protein [Clostridia bacterium]